jgi:hypothetical protein
MAKLTDEDLRALERLKEFERQIEAVPESERVPVTNPRMTDNIAIGLDEHGEYRPHRDFFGRPITEEQVLRRIAARDNIDPAEIADLRERYTDEDMRGLLETIERLHQQEPLSETDDKLLAEFEAYYELLSVPARTPQKR